MICFRPDLSAAPGATIEELLEYADRIEEGCTVSDREYELVSYAMALAPDSYNFGEYATPESGRKLLIEAAKVLARLSRQIG